MTGFIIQVINYTQVAINEYQRNCKEFPPFSGYGVIHDNMKGHICICMFREGYNTAGYKIIQIIFLKSEVKKK